MSNCWGGRRREEECLEGEGCVSRLVGEGDGEVLGFSN